MGSQRKADLFQPHAASQCKLLLGEAAERIDPRIGREHVRGKRVRPCALPQGFRQLLERRSAKVEDETMIAYAVVMRRLIILPRVTE
jgi:hypothetical protein